MKRLRTVVFLLISLVLISCGGGRRLPSTPSFNSVSPVTAAERTAPVQEITLQEALSELETLQVPEGVDSALFEELKAALRDALAAKGASKLISKPPVGEANRVDDLELIDNSDGTYTLTWSYKNVGDYNQDGIVSIADITPLAVHFNEPADETNEWIDGNSDGIISIADITPLAVNFLNDVAGYAVEGSDEVKEASSQSLFVDFAQAIGIPKRFYFRLESLDYSYYQVVSTDSKGNRGIESTQISSAGFGNTRWHPGIIHAHSTFSDGSDNIPRRVERAKEANVKFLVVTDHYEWINERDKPGSKYFGGQDFGFEDYIRNCSEQTNSDFVTIPGAEIASFWSPEPEQNNRAACHTLALGPVDEDSLLLELGRNPNIPDDDPHQSFDKQQDIINEVNQRGWLSVAAHPSLLSTRTLPFSWEWQDMRYDRNKAEGIQGIEIFNTAIKSVTTPEDENWGTISWYLDLIRQGKPVFVTSGCDSHDSRLDVGIVDPDELKRWTRKTWVFSEKLETESLLDAIAQGRTYAANYGASFEFLNYIPGFQVREVERAKFLFKVKFEDEVTSDKTVRIYRDGILIPESVQTVLAHTINLLNGFYYVWEDKGAEDGEYQYVIEVEGHLITSPIRLKIGPEPEQQMPPVAKVKADPLIQGVNQPIHFSGDGSYDPDGGLIVKYEWDWESDGTYDEEGIEADHSWSTKGTYHVQLRVTDDEGATDVLDERLEVVITKDDSPFNPVEINHVDTGSCAYEVAISGGYAHVADSGPGLQIIDIDPPESAYIVNSVGAPNFAWEVAVSGGYAYVADIYFGLLIIDVEPPQLAYLVNSVDTLGAPYEVAVLGDYAYVAADESGLQIIDIDPPESAYIVKSVFTPDYASAVAVSGGYAYVGNGWLESTLQIIDIEPPSSAHIVNSVDMDFVHEVAISGGYAYVADFTSGLRIIDIELPESAFIVKSVVTPGGACGVAISGGYAYVADYWSGLQIIDIDPPESAYIVSSLDTPGCAYGVAVSGGYAYVADSEGGLRIIKIW